MAILARLPPTRGGPGVPDHRAREHLVADSPLEAYPNRDWEIVYRDLAREDDRFVFTCAPNDTHNCLLTAHTKNGVIVNISPTYGYGEATDLYGNKASHRWDPRCCQKGLAMARKFYGDRRIRRPRVRKGFREWVDAGLPRDPATGRRCAARTRGSSSTWDEAFDIAARTLQNIAETYSGVEGAERLRAQGYDEDMVASPNYGEAKGGRGWDNYTWHTDLPPDGHRAPDRRVRAHGPRARRRGRHLGDELNLDEDARRPLAHRGATQGHAADQHLHRLPVDVQQGRRGPALEQP